MHQALLLLEELRVGHVPVRLVCRRRRRRGWSDSVGMSGARATDKIRAAHESRYGVSSGGSLRPC